jgi:hypothetical protein
MSILGRIAMRYWRWKYGKLDAERVREWIAQSIDERTMRPEPFGSAAIQPRKN